MLDGTPTCPTPATAGHRPCTAHPQLPKVDTDALTLPHIGRFNYVKFAYTKAIVDLPNTQNGPRFWLSRNKPSLGPVLEEDRGSSTFPLLADIYTSASPPRVATLSLTSLGSDSACLFSASRIRTLGMPLGSTRLRLYQRQIRSTGLVRFA